MFLQEELPIRLAHRVAELQRLPHGLSDMPSVVKVKNWYAESFEELINFPTIALTPEMKQRLKNVQRGRYLFYQAKFKNCGRYHVEMSDDVVPSGTDDFNANFKHLIEGIKTRHDPVVTSIATGILELRAHTGQTG